MNRKSTVGELGEKIARDFLKNKGYRVLAQNVWEPWGEIDIIARDRGGVLVFAEVKALWTTYNEARPEGHYGTAKDRKTKRAVQLFIQKNQKMFNDAIGYRIDLIAIHIKSELLENWEQGLEIRHYENI